MVDREIVEKTNAAFWKPFVARIVQWPFVQSLMVLGIRMVVARHRVGVSVVPLDERGRILLLHHVFHPYVPWGLPGGWLEGDENPDACALRELKEETNLTARLGPVVHVARESGPSHLNIAYLAYVRAQPVQFSAEIMKANWFYPDELPQPLFPFTERAIRLALEQHRRIV